MRLGMTVGCRLLAVAVLGACALEARAQVYPARAVRLVVPFSAGAAADTVMRIITHELSGVMGQQVIVDNRPGAGSIIGAEAVARAAPDGYTLLAISNTHFVSAALHSKLSYDAVKDFAAVTQVTSATNLVVVHPSLPVHTLQQLIALAKTRPGKIDYASSGSGSTQHLVGALFTSMAGVDMTHVPYRGSGSALSDLLSGHVTVGFPGIGSTIPLLHARKLRALAVTSARRSSELPDVPTVAESGLRGFEVDAWLGIAAPRATPRAIVMKLHGDLLRTLKHPDASRSLVKVGHHPTWRESPEAFSEMLAVEARKWAAMVKASGARVD